MHTLTTLRTSPIARLLVVIFLCMTLFSLSLPMVVFAQTTDDGSGTVAPTPAGSQTPPTDRCAWYSSWSSPVTCIFRALFVGSSSGLIWLTGWILGIAGVLFNAALEFTTQGFDSQIYAKIQGGIEAVWTAFRDIANILIIGMFTFTALTMILGIESFNAKKMVAKVLLIAVLINFSLLFTRLVIASSNFVAVQFYKAAKFDTSTSLASAQSVAGQTSPYNQFSAGISGKFAQLMGVAGFSDSAGALWEIAQKQDSGLLALGQGVLTALIFTGAALVFLYASFLLIARAILFVLLLITSSLAFAAHLLPSKITMGYDGWSAWWSSLLKNAVFGPMLLILLWATIQLGEGIRATNSTLGSLLVDPAKGGGINALFSYLLILGMLYASIKIASMFANKVGGFNWAAVAPAWTANKIMGFGGFGARQTVGRGGAWVDKTLTSRAAAQPDTFGGKMRRSLLQIGASAGAAATKRDFNLAKTKVGAELGAVSGLKIGKEKALGGFDGTEKRRAEAFAEQGEKFAKAAKDLSADTKKQIALQGNPELRDRSERADANHGQADRDNQANQQRAMQLADDHRRAVQNEETLRTNVEQLRLDRQQMEQDVRAGRRQQSELDEQDNRIRDTQSRIIDSRQRNSTLQRQVDDARRTANESQQAFTQAARNVQNVTKEIEDRFSAGGFAENLAYNRLSNTLLKPADAKDDALAQRARAATGDRARKKRLRDALADDVRDTTREFQPPPAPTNH